MDLCHLKLIVSNFLEIHQLKLELTSFSEEKTKSLHIDIHKGQQQVLGALQAIVWSTISSKLWSTLTTKTKIRAALAVQAEMQDDSSAYDPTIWVSKQLFNKLTTFSFFFPLWEKEYKDSFEWWRAALLALSSSRDINQHCQFLVMIMK